MELWLNAPLLQVCRQDNASRKPFLAISQEPFSPDGRIQVLLISWVPYEHRDVIRAWVEHRIGKDWQKFFDFGDYLWRVPIREFPVGLADDNEPAKILDVCREWYEVLSRSGVAPKKFLWGIDNTAFGFEVPPTLLHQVLESWGIEVEACWK